MDGVNNLRDFLYLLSGYIKYLPVVFLFFYVRSYFRRDYR